METQFILSGIDFSYITFNDLPDIIRMLKKISVCEHLFFGPNTKEETKAYFVPLIESTLEALDDGMLPSDHLFSIRKNGKYVGHCGLIAVPYSEGNYTISYTLDDTFWQQGIGDLACKFLINYAFYVLNAQRVSGECMSTNTGSKRILEKNGFQQEGCRQNYWKKWGYYSHELLFGLLKPENQ